MFTGIIEETGTIAAIANIPGGKRLTIAAARVMDDLRVEHSVAVSGVCLTVVDINKLSFMAEAVGETLEKTTVKHFKTGTRVNLERAISLKDRLGGHLLQGHVNGIGRIEQITRRGRNWYFEFKLPQFLLKYVIPEGSIAIDGISLTVAAIHDDVIGLSIIPYTFENTTLNYSKSGDTCNIETDIIGRYVENLMFHENSRNKKSRISMDWLKKQGY